MKRTLARSAIVAVSAVLLGSDGLATRAEPRAGQTCRTALSQVQSLEFALRQTGDGWVDAQRARLVSRLGAARRRVRLACQASAPPAQRREPVVTRRDGLNRWSRLIRREARRNGLKPELLTAVIWVESAGDPRAVSRKGARGLMQLMPATARELGVIDPFDPRQNVAGGARYLRWLLDRLNGDARLALAAYNAGLNRVRRSPRWPAETQRYVRRVLSVWRSLEGRG